MSQIIQRAGGARPGDTNARRVLGVTLAAVLATGAATRALAQTLDEFAEFGVDYAFMVLTTLSPDIAAAHYEVRNPGGSPVEVRIGRIPYAWTLGESPARRWRLEIEAAYQDTSQSASTFADPAESIDSRWLTYGLGAGLLFDRALGGDLRLDLAARLGIAHLDNLARYNGRLTPLLRPQFDGRLFNWDSDAALFGLSAGLSHDGTRRPAPLKWRLNLHHARMHSFAESNPAVAFDESASMIRAEAELALTPASGAWGQRPAWSVLLGGNRFVGENRRTLGYVGSYEAGLAAELPFRWRAGEDGRLRLRAVLLAADDMDGWLIGLGYREAP